VSDQNEDHSEGRVKETFSKVLSHLHLTRLSAGIATATFVIVVLVFLWLTNLPKDLSGASVDWPLLALAPVAAVGQYLGFAIALRAACDPKPPLGQTLSLEIAESVTTVVTPEGVGSVALSLRYLTRRGMKSPEALAASGLNSFVTTAVATLFVPLGAIFASSSLNISALKSDVPSSQWVLIVGIIVVAGAATAIIKVPRLRRSASGWITTIRGYLSTLIRQPQRALAMAFGEVVTASAQVLCLSLILAALGAPISVAAILVICQLAGAASNVVPIPGGLGAPEAILVAGLVSVGVHHDSAILATLTYRMLTYWVPPVPGMIVIWRFHRAGRI
jgi:uncharacterized membrane protein YbhN (UPF0104 family)